MTATTTPVESPTVPDDPARVDAFAGELIDAAAGVFKIFSIYIGHKLGYYQTLADNAPLTSIELAELTRTHERYAREWLEQQTVAGVLDVLDETEGPFDRRYHLPPAQQEVLTDHDSLNYLAPLTQLLTGVVKPLPLIIDAYRDGSGVPFREYGPDARHGQAAINRVAFLQLLGRRWVPAVPGVHDRLTNPDRPARIADFGCGCGWSTIGIADAYPLATVDGFDTDLPSIEEARRNAADHGVAQRVRFHCNDVADLQTQHRYDLVLCCETIHDMGDPVGALRAAREHLADDGTVLVVDERVAERFTARGDGLEWMMYGWSILHCLPVGMADGAEGCCGGTGTVMRPATLKRYAQEAGFTRCDVLPIDNLFFRLYQLRP